MNDNITESFMKEILKNSDGRILTEEQWFDTYYPKSWGDWRKEYNLEMFQTTKDETACTYLDYGSTGFTIRFGGDCPILMVRSWVHGYPAPTNYFMEVDGENSSFIQPYKQPKDGKFFVKFALRKVESNLNLYETHFVGCDDVSYSKHYVGDKKSNFLAQELFEKDVNELMKDFTFILNPDSGFFFTN